MKIGVEVVSSRRSQRANESCVKYLEYFLVMCHFFHIQRICCCWCFLLSLELMLCCCWLVADVCVKLFSNSKWCVCVFDSNVKIGTGIQAQKMGISSLGRRGSKTRMVLLSKLAANTRLRDSKSAANMKLLLTRNDDMALLTRSCLIFGENISLRKTNCWCEPQGPEI